MQILLPAFKEVIPLETDRFPGRLFRVVYTSPATQQRHILPPARIDPYSFPQAVLVALQTYKVIPDWTNGDVPVITSIDGSDLITVAADELANLYLVSQFLHQISDQPVLSAPLVVRQFSRTEVCDDDDD